MAHSPTTRRRPAPHAAVVLLLFLHLLLAAACGRGGSEAVARCRSAGLQPRVASSDTGVGNRAVTVALRNAGADPCRIEGYPTVVLLDSADAPLDGLAMVASEGTPFQSAEPPVLVTLAPGAEASFQLAYFGPAAGDPCVYATGLRVAPPGDSTPVALVAPLEACGDRVRVTPIRRGAPEGLLAGPGVRVYLVTPSGALGLITPTTTEASLVRDYGAARVRRGEVPLVEGTSEPGTVLFPDDSARRLEIVWADTAGRRLPRLARFAGTRSVWTVGAGLTLGLTLREVERINRGPFSLAGFEWDGEGFVMSWRGGTLSRVPAGAQRVLARLRPRRDYADTSAAANDVHQLIGIGPFPSSDPRMRRVNPRVDEVAVRFR